MDKRITTILFFIACYTLKGFGQEVSFRSSAPESVFVGQEFRITYTVNDEGRDFKVPKKMDPFEILYGPMQSSTYKTSIVRGKAIKDVAIHYTLVLRAKKEGRFIIQPASIQVKGKTFTSDPVVIKVDSKEKKDNGYESDENSYSKKDTNAKEAFVRTIVSKTKVREQEAFLLTFRFYSKWGVQNIRHLDISGLDGFTSEDVSIGGSPLQRENIAGENYYAADIKKLVLTPQKQGKLVIPEAKIEAVLQIPTGIRTLFGEELKPVVRTLWTNSLKIQVYALPKPIPPDFSNGVGSFTLKSFISSTEVKEDEPVTIRIVISGKGNPIQVKNLDLKLPDQFVTYPPRISQNGGVDENNDLQGTKAFEYVFIPLDSGDYTIPSIPFVYFDTESNKYKTLTTPGYTLKVNKNPNKRPKGVLVMLDDRY